MDQKTILKISDLVWDVSVAYYGCPYYKHNEADLREIAEAGFTSITLCVNEYEWPNIARVKELVVSSVHDLGLRAFVDLHGFGFFVPGHFSISVPNNPSWCEIDNESTPYPIRGCPNNPGYRSWLIGRVKDVVNRLRPDGIFWDEPSLIVPKGWPKVWTCRCPTCRDVFRADYGHDMPKDLTDEVREFRQRSIFGLLDELTSEASRIGGDLINILCLMPEHTGMHGIYSWEPLQGLKSLDVFSTDPYWIWGGRSFEWFIEWVNRALEISKRAGLKTQIWVELIKVPRGHETDVYRSVIKAVELGSDAIATWSFRAEEGSELSCDDPDTAWNAMVKAVREVKGLR